MAQQAAMSVSVCRDYYYEGSDGGVLIHPEYSPARAVCARQKCNCTKIVHDKPEGDPSDVAQRLELARAVEDYDLSVLLRNGLSRFLFCRGDEQARFQPDVNGVQNELSVQLTSSTTLSAASGIKMADYSSVGCLLGRIYFGNSVDTSQLLNGYSPSRIVDLKALSPNDIWAHACVFGAEAMRVFRPCEETDGWWQTKSAMDEIARRASGYMADLASPVGEVRDRILMDRAFLASVSAVADWLHDDVLRDPKATEMFRCCDEARTDAEAGSLRLAEARQRRN